MKNVRLIRVAIVLAGAAATVVFAGSAGTVGPAEGQVSAAGTVLQVSAGTVQGATDGTENWGWG
jgi:hypothetical protein